MSTALAQQVLSAASVFSVPSLTTRLRTQQKVISSCFHIGIRILERKRCEGLLHLFRFFLSVYLMCLTIPHRNSCDHPSILCALWKAYRININPYFILLNSCFTLTSYSVPSVLQTYDTFCSPALITHSSTNPRFPGRKSLSSGLFIRKHTYPRES